jgi:hypothetical protein
MATAKSFFKATDGKFTVFRGTASFGFASATIRTGENHVFYIAFSSKMIPGNFPTVEIGKQEYEALVRAKLARVRAAGGDTSCENGPQCSWVRNADLAATGAV